MSMDFKAPNGDTARELYLRRREIEKTLENLRKTERTMRANLKPIQDQIEQASIHLSKIDFRLDDWRLAFDDELAKKA